MRVYGDAQKAAEGCGVQIAEWLAEVVSERGVASLAVSGGSTPRLMFKVLVSLKLPWGKIHLFQVDERGVAPDDEQSNYGMMRENLVEPAGIPEQNVHRMLGEMEAVEAAALYAEEVRQFFGGAARFDVVQCGVGDDGHTASLFPGDGLVEDRKGTVAGVWVPKKKQWRITLLPGPIMGSSHLCVLASGAGKAEAVRRALQGELNVRETPAQLLRDGEWFVDEAAVSRQS